eukprot:scaffold64049_cov32-Attheya_sp.AAC.1
MEKAGHRFDRHQRMQGSGLVVNVSIVAKGVGRQSHKRTPSRQQTIAHLLQQTRNNLCELTTCDYATISQYIPSHIAIADIVVDLNNIIDDDITLNEQSEWLSQAKDETGADITRELHYDLGMLLCETSLA